MIQVGRHILRLGGIAVIVGSGAAWITRKGQSRDWILEAGQRMVLAGKGWVVQNLSADEELCLRLEPLRGIAPPELRAGVPHRA